MTASVGVSLPVNHVYPGDYWRFYLAGQWQSRMYPLEVAKRPLAHTTRNCKISPTKSVKPTGFELWSKKSGLLHVPTRPLWLSQMKTGLCTKYISTKNWYCTFLACNFIQKKLAQYNFSTTLHCVGGGGGSTCQVFELIIMMKENNSMLIHFQQLCKTLNRKFLNCSLYWRMAWFRLGRCIKNRPENILIPWIKK